MYSREPLKDFARHLFDAQVDHAAKLPNADAAESFIEGLLAVLFPHFSTCPCRQVKQLEARLTGLEAELTSILAPLEHNMPGRSEEVSHSFFSRLPKVYDLLVQDAEAIYLGDPAADSVDEVIAAYPGFYVISVYRIAHEFHQARIPILPRMVTELAHRRTGIDIHPAASIGHSFCIDHGTGIVVGETTEIGDRVKLYQGVTLGALSVDKGMACSKRHPTVESDVVIYSNATILGGETRIGHHSIIGGNVWLTESVPPNSMVYHQGEVRVHTSANA